MSDGAVQHNPPSRTRRGRRVSALLLVGLLPGAASAESSPTAPSGAPPLSAPSVANHDGIVPVDRQCLADTLCALKEKVRWGTPAWSPRTCRRVADAVLAAAAEYDLSPALLLAVALNESDLDDKAATAYRREGAVYAKDAGLMGIRCVFDGRGRCGNGHVRGLSFRTVMDPAKNVALGARELAYFRDEGGVERRTVRERTGSGGLTTRTRMVRCKHRSHAYWAHYNHGSFYISRGYARHYPHRVAVLYHALARVLGLPAPELASGPITVRDPGRRPRTADRPVEPRYRILTDKIQMVGGRCPAPLPTTLAAR
jgi:hypothetical protein